MAVQEPRDGGKAFEQWINEPTTRKDRIYGVIAGLLLIGFAVCTWLWPDLIVSQWVVRVLPPANTIVAGNGPPTA